MTAVVLIFLGACMNSFPRRADYVLLAGVLTVISAFLFIAARLFPESSGGRDLFYAFAGAAITFGWIEVLHEFFVASHVRDEFKILADFVDKGIRRICTKDELKEINSDSLKDTHTLGVLGIGLSWLFDGENRQRFEQLLREKGEVRVLVPDPCSHEIIARYEDEPTDFELGLPGLADRLRNWQSLHGTFPTLQVHVYKSYPAATLTLYDNVIFVGNVLYKQRAKDNLTAVYRRPSRAAVYYESHFSKLFLEGSVPIEKYDFKALDNRYSHIGKAVAGR